MTVDRDNEAYYTGCDQTITVLLFSDKAQETRYDATGATVKVRVTDASTVATTYTATIVTAASGNYTITLDSAQNHVAGKFSGIVLIDDKPFGRPKVARFIELP